MLKEAIPSLLILVLLVTVTFAATEWNRTVALTGGGSQRFSTVISNGGYTAGATFDELTICNPNSETIYIGASNVNSNNGFPLANGDCKTERRAQVPIDGTQKWLWINSNGNVSVSIRSTN